MAVIFLQDRDFFAKPYREFGREFCREFLSEFTVNFV